MGMYRSRRGLDHKGRGGQAEEEEGGRRKERKSKSSKEIRWTQTGTR